MVHIIMQCATIKPGMKSPFTALGTIVVIALFTLLHARVAHTQSTPTSGGTAPAFEVASIKPNRSGDMGAGIQFAPGRFIMNGATVRMLISVAYDVRDFQISGGPGWVASDKYDIQAKEPDAIAEELEKLPRDQRREKMGLLIQSLLTDRFALKLAHTTKELPVYALVVAQNGPKLQEAKPGDTYPNGFKNPDASGGGAGPAPGGGPPRSMAIGRGPDGHAPGGMMMMGRGQLTGQGVPIKLLVQALSQQLGRTVVDQTGLKGNYDFTLKWTPDQNSPAMAMGPGGPAPGAPPPGADNAPPPDTSGPSVFTAIQEQLGLKLEPTKGPVEILVIDHIERPSEN
jgi:uncharacterized protein (TIGR03435 family)